MKSQRHVTPTELHAGTGSFFAVQVLDKESMRCGSYFLRHSTHSSARMRQRGMDNHIISLAVQFGECFQKQGLEFYALSDRRLPLGLGQLGERARNTVVVIGPGGEIITCYRRRGGIKYLRKKQKYRQRFNTGNQSIDDRLRMAA